MPSPIITTDPTNAAAPVNNPERQVITPDVYAFNNKVYKKETRTDASGNPYQVDIEVPLTSNPSYTNAMTNTNTFGTVYSSSQPIVAEENYASGIVNRGTQDLADAKTASDEYRAELQRQYDALTARREADVSAINSSFDNKVSKTKEEQIKEKGTFTSTLARIGGYLGDSASAQGALVNLNQKHQFEIADLEAKRAAAIQEAKNAIDEKQSALALKKAQEAKDYSKEIQDRKDKFFAQSMQIVNAEREKQAEARLQHTANINDSTKIAENTASTLNDYLIANPTLTPEQKDAAIIEVAKAKGIDPIYVNQALADYRRALAQIDPEIVREYNFVKSMGQFNGTLIQYQKAKRDAMRVATTGGKVFTKEDANRYDLPKELIGKSEEDVISDLNVSKVPDWFKVSQVRAGNISKDAKPVEFQAQWDNFRNLPDIVIYRKTMDLNRVDSKSGNVGSGDEEPIFGN